MEGALFWVIKSVDFSLEKSFGRSSDTGPYDSKEARGFNMLPSEVFTSAWMSADGGPQWISVDLGSKRKFDEIRLHWIHRAEGGWVEVSDDAKVWRRVRGSSGDGFADIFIQGERERALCPPPPDGSG